MRIGLYNVLHYSQSLIDPLKKGMPDYFGPNAKWKFTYKQPSNTWRDSVDPSQDGDLTVEKINDNSARVKVTAKDKKGQSTSTIIGMLAK